MQVNHLAPALLSILLFPSLIRGSPSRIINVNSVVSSMVNRSIWYPVHIFTMYTSGNYELALTFLFIGILYGICHSLNCHSSVSIMKLSNLPGVRVVVDASKIVDKMIGDSITKSVKEL
uniref:Uncharacterized protein n=1 Tax=Rhizophora mucronata TaxID=61149 RepID=A0A2P2LIE2_RHIMU